jgi:hypothetical protein
LPNTSAAAPRAHPAAPRASHHTQAVQDLRAAGKSDKEIEKFSTLFKEMQQQIDSKQLRPFIRTQYMRTAFQVRRWLWRRSGAVCGGPRTGTQCVTTCAAVGCAGNLS